MVTPCLKYTLATLCIIFAFFIVITNAIFCNQASKTLALPISERQSGCQQHFSIYLHLIFTFRMGMSIAGQLLFIVLFFSQWFTKATTSILISQCAVTVRYIFMFCFGHLYLKKTSLMKVRWMSAVISVVSLSVW